MHLHPDQLTPQEAAYAVATVAGLRERLKRLSERIDHLWCRADHVLPTRAHAAETDGTERADQELAEAQVDAAETACEILAEMDLLAARMAIASRRLAACLADAAQAEAQAIAEHFGKAA